MVNRRRVPFLPWVSPNPTILRTRKYEMGGHLLYCTLRRRNLQTRAVTDDRSSTTMVVRIFDKKYIYRSREIELYIHSRTFVASFLNVASRDGGMSRLLPNKRSSSAGVTTTPKIFPSIALKAAAAVLPGGGETAEGKLTLQRRNSCGLYTLFSAAQQ